MYLKVGRWGVGDKGLIISSLIFTPDFPASRCQTESLFALYRHSEDLFLIQGGCIFQPVMCCFIRFLVSYGMFGPRRAILLRWDSIIGKSTAEILLD